MVRTSRLKYS